MLHMIFVIYVVIFFAQSFTCAQAICPPGNCINLPKNECKVCPPGSYSNGTFPCSNAGECNQCPSGYYCPQHCGNPVICVQCAYCPPGSSKPTLCTSETYSKEKLAVDISQCLPCPAGMYCSPKECDGEITLSCLNASPTPCPRGSYCPLRSSVYIPCPAGTYNVHTQGRSLVSCKDCPVGHYCADPSLLPVKCPKHHFCGIKTVHPRQCIEDFNCSAATATISCPAGE